MKRLILGLCLGGSLLGVQAQQKPHYTQYILNNYIINPAITGIENYTDVKFSHRHQWVGLQDAPVTTYFTIHKAIGKKDDRTSATSFRMPGENPPREKLLARLYIGGAASRHRNAIDQRQDRALEQVLRVCNVRVSPGH